MEDSSPTRVCRSSCLSEVAFGFFLLVIVLLFVLPVGLFYGWRDPDVNEWQKEKAFSTVLEHIENCTSQKYEDIEDTKVIVSLLWNKVWSDCQNFSDEAMESPPVTIAINETRLVHISQQSTKGSLFFSIQTEPLVGQNDSICNEPAPVYSFCQRLSYFFLNRDGTGTPKPNMTAEAGKTVHISKAITSTTVMTLPLGCNLSNGTAIGKFLHYLQDKRGTFVTSSKMPEQLTHSYSSVNGSGNVSTECTSEYLNMCGVCVPKCSSTHRYLPTISGETIEENMLIAACVVAIFGEIVFIVLALIRRNEILTFPTVLVLYETINEMAIAMTLLIPRAGNNNLWFCSHDDAIRTMYSDPTPFCSFSGVVIQFAMVSTFICWMVHILYIGVLVKFPFFGKKLQKKSKQIHIATVLAAIFLASIGPVVTLAHVGYFTARFPVVTCLPRNMDVLFFSIALPLTVLIGLVTVILMFLFRELRKTFNSKIERKRRSLSPALSTNIVSTAERKVLFLAIAFFSLGVIILGRFCQNFGNQYAFTHKLAEYSNCQLQARDGQSMECSMLQDYPEIYRAVCDSCVYFLFAMLPYINWTFPLKPSDFKKLKDRIVLSLLAAKAKFLPVEKKEQIDFV